MYAYESLAPFHLKHKFTMVVAGPFKSSKMKICKAVGTQYPLDFTTT
jgi:hypothetical protein